MMCYWMERVFETITLIHVASLGVDVNGMEESKPTLREIFFCTCFCDTMVANLYMWYVGVKKLQWGKFVDHKSFWQNGPYSLVQLMLIKLGVY